MQYKTVSATQQIRRKRKVALSDPGEIGREYAAIINREARNGWKFIGIHTTPVITRASCLRMCVGILDEKWQIDTLIFYRDDDGYVDPDMLAYEQQQAVIAAEKQRRQEEKAVRREQNIQNMKNAGATFAGMTMNAFDAVKSGEAKKKFTDMAQQGKDRFYGQNTDSDANDPENSGTDDSQE